MCSIGCSDYSVHRAATEDVFEQGEGAPPVDVLWIVDDSGTMSEEQELLAGNFSAFAEVLLRSDADFHVGVTTTDIDAEAGALVGEYLTADTVDIEATFAAQAADLGISGSRDEQPLEAARMALTDPVASDANAGFLREGADLQVVVVTDEDDHSREDVSVYLSALDTVKGDAPWALSAIAGNAPDGCHSAVADAQVATRVLDAVEQSGGTFASICATDFSPIMTSLALTASRLSDTFYLSRMPVLSTLEVRVDDVLIKERATDGWQYDAGDNAVVFDGYAVPRAGQHVTLTYFDLLGPGDTGAATTE